MNNKETLDFYKEIYYKEFDRKDKIDESIALPITVIFGLSAFVYSMLSEFDFKYNTKANIYFLAPVFIGSVFILASIISLVMFYFSSGWYRAFPLANEIEIYRVGLLNYWLDEDPANHEDRTEADFSVYVKNLYIEQSATNTKKNDTKSKWNERIKMCLLGSIIFLVISLWPFFINFFNKPDKTYIVQNDALTHRVEEMTTVLKKATMKTPVENSTPPAKPVPTKPTPPRERLIREGREPVQRPVPPKPSTKK